MNEKEARDCIPRHLETQMSGGNCASLRTGRSTCDNTPAFLSNGTLATITQNEASSHNDMCLNEVAVADGGTEMGRDITEDRVTVNTIKRAIDKESNRAEPRMCKKTGRHQHMYSFDDRNVHISTFLGESSSVERNSSVASHQDLKNRIDCTSTKRSFRIGPNRSRIAPRRYSLPSCLSSLSVRELPEIVLTNEATTSGVRNILPSGDFSHESCCIELSAANLIAAATPPPSYRSLITHNLSDIPPSYECVTGLSLNIGQVSGRIGCSFCCFKSEGGRCIDYFISVYECNASSNV